MKIETVNQQKKNFENNEHFELEEKIKQMMSLNQKILVEKLME